MRITVLVHKTRVKAAALAIIFRRAAGEGTVWIYVIQRHIRENEFRGVECMQGIGDDI